MSGKNLVFIKNILYIGQSGEQGSTGLFIIIGTASKSRCIIQIRSATPSKLYDIVF